MVEYPFSMVNNIQLHTHLGHIV